MSQPNGRNGHPTAPGFQLQSEHPVPLLKLVLQHYQHGSGADHFHLASEDDHRSFSVAFRTVPEDSTGLPHILEHLVLCGSDRFPVRDPFFMMTRRSLATFMNAMTSSDCTYYPFSSQVEKDFYNLLDIYLDATFKPNLNPLDFAQEGYRIEPAELGEQPQGPEDWAFKGVVYNEMKGARGNADSQVFQKLTSTLLPDTPYRFDSGGDPAVIPNLDHGDLVAFHDRHYCAGNACLVTYGNLDVDRLHARFEPYLLARPGSAVRQPDPQPAIELAERVDVPVPLEPGQDPRDVSLARLAWVWEGASSLEDVLLGELIDQLLLGHAGAPLRLALESSGLGRSMGGSGFFTMGRDGLFFSSLKGVQPEQADRMIPLVMDCLGGIVETGIPESEIEAALHQLELDRRRISGDRFPFGLELAMRVTEAWRLGHEPDGYLDMESELATLRQRALEPGFLTQTIQQRFLDLPHRAFFVAQPDVDFNQRQADAERERLESRVRGMPSSALMDLIEEADQLAARQATADDPEILPELMLDDVPAARSWAEGEEIAPGTSAFEAGTNGILHQVAALPLGGLSQDEILSLPMLAGALGQLGVGDHDYMAQAARLNALCAGLSAWTDLRGGATDKSALRGYLFLEVSGLARRQSEWAELLAETLAEQRFDEHERVSELAKQSLTGLQQRVNWSGHELALQAAARGFGARAGLSHALGGLGRLASLKTLERAAAEDPNAIAELAASLESLLTKIRQAPLRLALIGDAASDSAAQAGLSAAWSVATRLTAEDADARSALQAGGSREIAPTAFTTATQVSYCALAFPAPPLGHADAPALAVAARYLSNNYLHPKLRETGGAYGGRASYNSQAGLFGLSSYRDPRLDATYYDMRESLAALPEIGDDDRLLRESILGVIAGLDRPASPAGEARRRFVADLMGFGPAVINDFRQRVLAVTCADIRQAAERWLSAQGGSAAVVTSETLLGGSDLDWQQEAI